MNHTSKALKKTEQSHSDFYDNTKQFDKKYNENDRGEKGEKSILKIDKTFQNLMKIVTRQNKEGK